MNFKEVSTKYLQSMISLFISSFNCYPWNDKWTPSIVEQRLLQLINTPGFDGLLAFEENKLIGLILGNEEYTYSDKQFVIKEFCVDNNIKGKGIGSMIIKEFETRLKNKNYTNISLMTLRSNATIGFYEKHDYEVDDNLVIMTKPIKKNLKFCFFIPIHTKLIKSRKINYKHHVSHNILIFNNIKVFKYLF